MLITTGVHGNGAQFRLRTLNLHLVSTVTCFFCVITIFYATAGSTLYRLKLCQQARLQVSLMTVVYFVASIVYSLHWYGATLKRTKLRGAWTAEVKPRPLNRDCQSCRAVSLINMAIVLVGIVSLQTLIKFIFLYSWSFTNFLLKVAWTLPVFVNVIEISASVVYLLCVLIAFKDKKKCNPQTIDLSPLLS